MRMKQINLHYIRAAIEANTGVYGLSLERVRQYLVEEGLLTPDEARKYAPIFNGYDEFFDHLAEADVESPELDHLDWEIPLETDD
jgi:hypothetical protein